MGDAPMLLALAAACALVVLDGRRARRAVDTARARA
jgi:hypothetical protein